MSIAGIEPQAVRAADASPLFDQSGSILEEAGYLDQEGEQLYYVLHAPHTLPRAQVVLAPPIGYERDRVYFLWLAWARLLAQHGFEVLRFDYRATGESTGRFEDISFASWYEDLKLSASFLRHRTIHSCPLLLHGLRLGGALAAKLFNQGTGDALLLWSPLSGADQCRHGLRVRLAADLAAGAGRGRRSCDQYISELEAGRLVEVHGDPWSKRLWDSARDVPMQFPESSEMRPWLLTWLDQGPQPAGAVGNCIHVPMRVPPFAMMGDPLVVTWDPLFQASVEWVEAAVARLVGGI